MLGHGHASATSIGIHLDMLHVFEATYIVPYEATYIVPYEATYTVPYEPHI